MSLGSAVTGVILLPGEDHTNNKVEPPIKRRRLSFSISGGSAVQEVGHVPGHIIDLEDDDDCTDLFDDFELSPKDEFQSPPSSPGRQEQEKGGNSLERMTTIPAKEEAHTLLGKVRVRDNCPEKTKHTAALYGSGT